MKEITFDNNNIKKIKLLCSDFYSQDNKDYHIQYFAIYLENNKKEDIKKSGSLDKLYDNQKEFEIEDIKNELRSIEEKNISSHSDLYKYAEILSNAGFHSKSYEIIKKIYKSNYNKTDKILSNIIENTKNEKLKKSVVNFIKFNKIKESIFSEELFNAVKEEVDTYLKDKNTKWII